jgi:hypothetical protein
MPPAHTFAKLCTSAKIAVPPKTQHIAFLTNAGIQNTNAPAKDIHERCAALAWARASIAATTDPDSWPTMLDASLHPTLLGLYALPQHRGSDPPPRRTSSASPLPSSCTTRPLLRLPPRFSLLLLYRPKMTAASSTLLARST